MEREPLRPAHLASVVVLMVGMALTASAALAVAGIDLSCLDFCVGSEPGAWHVFGAPAVFSILAALMLTVGIVVAVKSRLFPALALPGRSWAALLSFGGPVRTPFEWIRLWVATMLIAGVLAAASMFVSLIVGFSGDLSSSTGPSPFAETAAHAILVFVSMVAYVAALLAVFSVVCLLVGVVGFGVRSGLQSEKLR